jgi:hypothetical protein
VKKLLFLAAAGVGYVFGARAGRERYDQIANTVTKVKNDPRVQEKTQQAVETAKQHAPVVADKVTTVAGAAASKVKGSSDDSPEPHFMAGPQGDLP